MKTSRIIIPAIICAMTALASCEDKTPKVPDKPKPAATISKADQFSIDMLSSYYLWSEEISSSLGRLDPDTCCSPAEVVKEIRYKSDVVNKTGYVDRWTVLTDDLEGFTNSVQGLGVSYGYELSGGVFVDASGKSTGKYFLLVDYVCKNGPAEKAGLKRGDIFITINGKDITAENINDVFNSTSITLGLGIYDGSSIKNSGNTVSLTAVNMYEDPILLSKVFDLGTKKVGYLVYNSFDLRSLETLPAVFRDFKAQGIKELIMDFRYNGGGYAFTECALASMIAPPVVVASRRIFQTEIFNSWLTKAWEEQNLDLNTYFDTKFSITYNGTTYSANVSDANPGVSKVYFITTGATASASEGVIVGLGPYIDMTLVGERTYGKYCAGYMLSPDDLYDSSKYDFSLIKDWGMYVMVSSFGDKDGHNRSNPADPTHVGNTPGIAVDIESYDDPFDGFQLGDENETMLKAALTAAGKVYSRTRAQEPVAPKFGTRRLEHGMPAGTLIGSRELPKLRDIQ